MPPLDVQFVTVKSTPLAVVRRQVRPSDYATVVPASCGLVWSYLQAQHLQGGRQVAMYFDAGSRIEVGVEIDAPFQESDDVVRSATPAGLAATAVHYGPYDRLGEVHDAIQRWCASEGHRLEEPCWEIYAHWEREWNADSSRIRTDVFYRLAPART